MKSQKFDVSKYIDNEEMVFEYLKAAFEENDPQIFIAALRHVAKATEGSTQINYEQVKKAFHGLINEDELTDKEYDLYEKAFLASFKIHDGEPEKLEAKYSDNGNFTGVDEDGVFWGYDENGDFGIVPLK